MEAKELRELYIENLRVKSGLEQHRPYLGMSSIGQCPRLLYNQFFNGRGIQTARDHWFCREGYLHQGDVIELLGGRPKETEVIADFDARFRGHTGWETHDGDLVEIKTVTWEKLNRIMDSRRAERNHYEQVQMYLTHGGWQVAHILYKARDVPLGEWNDLPIWIITVRPNPEAISNINGKAKMILRAIDEQRPPKCYCGRCL